MIYYGELLWEVLIPIWFIFCFYIIFVWTPFIKVQKSSIYCLQIVFSNSESNQ